MYTLYILRNGNTNQYKIGYTGNFNKRIKQLQTGCPNELITIKIWQHYKKEEVKKYERVLHRFFTKQGKRIRPNGEWFTLDKMKIDILTNPQGIRQQGELIKKILKLM